MTTKTVYINHEHDEAIGWFLKILFVLFIVFMVFLFSLNKPLRVIRRLNFDLTAIQSAELKP